ncbi:glycosyltransferase [Patescibacteria group bacterium]
MKILLVIPAYNEEKIIKDTLLEVGQFLNEQINDEYLVVVADNRSADQTAEIVKELSSNDQGLDYLFIEQKGKGIAIRTAWNKYQDQFDIFIFMDADLATDLKDFPALIQGIKDGNDIVVGSRYLKESEVTKTVLRRIFSFGYRLILRVFLGTKVKDLPCGFKAVNKKVITEILPEVDNNTWFFDNEFVYLAEKKGFKIKEIPVKWQEPRTAENKSRVNIIKVSWLYLKEIWRLKFKK